MLGETEERVKSAIASLEARGVIVKYAAIVDLDGEEEECVKQFVYESDKKFTYSQFFRYLADICTELDVPIYSGGNALWKSWKRTFSEY